MPYQEPGGEFPGGLSGDAHRKDDTEQSTNEEGRQQQEIPYLAVGGDPHPFRPVEREAEPVDEQERLRQPG